MRIVSNTSPLIFLSKLNKIKYLSQYEVHVPKEVLDEIKKGEHPDYEVIVPQLDSFRISEAKILKNLPENLGKGEKAALSLAVQLKIKHVLVDEARARKVARLLGLEPRGTIGIIIAQYKSKRITKQECKNLILALIKAGYRISEDVLSSMLTELN